MPDMNTAAPGSAQPPPAGRSASRAQAARICRHDASGVRALVLHGDHVPVCSVAVLRAADVRQDGAAGAGRLALGVGCRRLLLPGRAAGRLLLRAFPDRAGLDASDRPDPPRRVHAGVSRAADRAAVGLGRSADGRALSVADRTVHRGDRPAVRRGFGQRAAVAGLVRPHRPSPWPRSLLPVCGEQPRQPDRAAGLPLRARAGVRAQGAQPSVGAGVPAADRGLGRGLHRHAHLPDRAWRRGRGKVGRRYRRDRCRPADVDGSPGLDRPGAGALGAADGLHHPCHDRCRLGAAAVGAAARALPAHLRPGVPRQAAHSPHGAAVSPSRRRGLRPADPVADQARDLVPHGGGRRHGLLHVRHGGSPYAVRGASRGAIPHRVLPVDVVRGSARRAVGGADRAQDLQRGVRVSAAAGAVDGLPAGRVRRRRAGPRGGKRSPVSPAGS